LRGRTKLKALNLPSSIKEVGDRAWNDCVNLQQVILPAAVTDLGPEPFKGCENLLTVTAPGLVPADFEEPEARLAAALGFCVQPGVYEEASSTLYKAYVQLNSLLVLKRAMTHNLTAAAAYLLQQHLLPAENFGEALAYAQSARTMEIVALLLNYRQTQLSEAAQFNELTLE
jgi:hypothetical protein